MASGTIAVTGGSGKAGRAVVHDLLDRGYEVRNVDLAPSTGGSPASFLRADLTDLDQAFEALQGTDAVVHLAAIPDPDIAPSEVTFRTNLTSTYNVFTAATTLGLRRIVWASSETTLGLPFERHPPRYVPVDEEHPLVPDTSYALSKVLGEEMARHFSAWHDGLAIIGLRFSNVMEPQDYVQFPDWQDDPGIRSWNAWGYVDARDVAQACRLALEADVTGADAFIIAAGVGQADGRQLRLDEAIQPARAPVTERIGRELQQSVVEPMQRARAPGCCGPVAAAQLHPVRLKAKEPRLHRPLCHPVQPTTCELASLGFSVARCNRGANSPSSPDGDGQGQSDQSNGDPRLRPGPAIGGSVGLTSADGSPDAVPL